MISIVTPCLNREEYIAEAVESVLAQNYANFEHIIADGGSTDGTLAILKRYPHLKVTSEPDKNLYDALNKAIRLARGEIIGHLNSDDTYEPEVFPKIIDAFARNPQATAVYGGATIFVDAATGRRDTLQEIKGPEAQELSLSRILFSTPIINARFFLRRVYDQLGLYDLRYRISADKEFLIRASLQKIPGARIDQVVYHYRQHGTSLTFRGMTQADLEAVAEHLAIAEDLLAGVSLSRQESRIFRDWHTQQTLVLFLHALRAMSIKELISATARGLRYDGRWPLTFAVAGARRMLGLPDRFS